MFVFLFLTMMAGPPFLLNCLVAGYGGCLGKKDPVKTVEIWTRLNLRLKMKKNKESRFTVSSSTPKAKTNKI